MPIKQQMIALFTIIQREWIRMFRIAIQIFLAPIISSVLYFIIFGTVIGQRVGHIDGFNYTQYIAPGLIMLAVITNAYSNVAASLYSARFQKNIEEFLISPAPHYILMLGYTIGGILRGLIIGSLVLAIASCFIHLNMIDLPMILLLIILVAACFSLIGFTNAILANSFEDIALIPTFVLSPLTYLGGVFYSTQMLPPFWQKASLFNPLLYMVQAFREVTFHQMGPQTYFAIGLMILLIGILGKFNLYLLSKGVGIQE